LISRGLNARDRGRALPGRGSAVMIIEAAPRRPPPFVARELRRAHAPSVARGGLENNAITQIEAVHGRRFAHPVTVGAYATPEAYAAANGLGSAVPMGVTFVGRVNLSPKLFGLQHQRLPAILTHELSHAHIQGWIGANAYIHLPN